MEVRVVSVTGVGAEVRVQFTTSIGGGVAGWHGQAPRVGDDCHVEFDLTDERVVASGEALDAIRPGDGERVVFVGGLEHIDDDGLLWIRVSKYFVWACTPTPVGLRVGQRVAAEGKLKLYPFDV